MFTCTCLAINFHIIETSDKVRDGKLHKVSTTNLTKIYAPLSISWST